MLGEFPANPSVAHRRSPHSMATRSLTVQGVLSLLRLLSRRLPDV